MSTKKRKRTVDEGITEELQEYSTADEVLRVHALSRKIELGCNELGREGAQKERRTILKRWRERRSRFEAKKHKTRVKAKPGWKRIDLKPLLEGATLEEIKEFDDLSEKRKKLWASAKSPAVQAEIEEVYDSVNKLRSRLRRRFRDKKATPESGCQEKQVITPRGTVLDDEEHGNKRLKATTPAKTGTALYGKAFVPDESRRKRIRVDNEHDSATVTAVRATNRHDDDTGRGKGELPMSDGHEERQTEENCAQGADCVSRRADGDGALVLEPIQWSRKTELVKEFREETTESKIGESACAVCDGSVLNALIKGRFVTRTLVSRVCSRLQPPHLLPAAVKAKLLQQYKPTERVLPTNLPSWLLKEYDVSALYVEHPQFARAMLSPRGVIARGANMVERRKIRMCNSCFTSLTNKRSTTPPKLSIANGLFIGVLPSSIPTPTRTEEKMVALISLLADIDVITRGQTKKAFQHPVLYQHTVMFNAAPGPVAAYLPNLLGQADPAQHLNVIFGGPMTTKEELQSRRSYAARRDVVDRMFKFFRDVNVLYDEDEIPIRQDLVDALDDEPPPGLIQIVNDPATAERVVNDTVGRITRPAGIDDAEKCQDAEEADIPVRQESSAMLENSLLPSMETLDVAGNNACIGVRRSTKIASCYRQSLLEMLLPCLFPAGRGGPTEKRQVPVSLKEYAAHVMSLSLNRFASNSTFILVVTDLISRRRAMEKASLRVMLSQPDRSAIATLSTDNLRRLFDHSTVVRDNALKGLPAPARPAGLEGAAQFVRCVKASNEVQWGSDEERDRGRRDLFGFVREKGLPHFFITVSPDGSNSVLAMHYGGKLKLTLDAATFDSLPSTAARRWADSAANPAANARSFIVMLGVFIRVVIGFDVKLGRSTNARGGAYGHARYFFHSVETQTAGGLHAHLALWINELLGRLKEFEARLVDPETGGIFRVSVCRFADSIARVDFPIRMDKVRCDFDCGDGAATIQPLRLPESARRALPPGCKTSPAAAECSICRRAYSSAQLLQMAVRLERRRLKVKAGNVGDGLAEVDESADGDHDQRIRGLSALPRPPPWPDAEPSDELSEEDWRRLHEHYLFLTEVGIKFQKHWEGHAPGCFKASASNAGDQAICRYRKPEERVCDTFLDEHNVVHLRRGLAMEYNNAYNDVALHTMRCNNDVRLLFDGTASDVLYYILKYIAKRQNKIDKFATLAMTAWTRKLKQLEESGESKSEHGLAVSLLQAVVHGVSNKMEMPATMAAYNIYAGGPFSKSHETVLVLVLQAIAVLHGEETEAQVLGTGDSRKIVRAVDDYVHRPDALDTICLMEFHKLFEKIRQNASDDEPLCSIAPPADRGMVHGGDAVSGAVFDATLCQPGTTLRFRGSHPQFRTHAIRRRGKEVIAVAAMDGLPDKEHLDSDAKQNRYAMRALVMFKPFRGKSDLCEAFASWWEAFLAWKPHPYAQRYIDNEQDLYDKRRCAADMRRDQHEQAEATGPDETVEQEPKSDDEESLSELLKEVGVDGDPDADRAALFDVLAGAAGDLPGAGVQNADRLVRDTECSGVADIIGKMTIGTLPDSTSMEPLCGPAGGDLDAMKASIEEQMLRARNKFCGLIDDDDDAADLDGVREVVEFNDLPMRVDLLVDAIEDSSRSDFSVVDAARRREAIMSLRDCPSLREVSEAHTLNALQHVAFKIIGSALLRSFTDDTISTDIDRSASTEEREQLKMYIGGAGGTGKTQLVRAVQSLADKWGRRGSVRTCAYSGIAAKAVGGRTVHGLLGIGIKGIKFKATDSIRARVRSMKMLFVDEVSMLPCSMMKTLNDRLNELIDWAAGTGQRGPIAHASSLKPIFGALHMVFVGDMKQLPPVAGVPLYKRPAKMESANGVGFTLWRTIDTVVELNENVRQASDPAYGAMLSRFRNGDYSNPNDWAMLNTRFADNEQRLGQLMETSHGKPSNKPPMVIVQTNSQRRSFNSAIFWKVARQLPGGSLPIRLHARIWAKRGGSSLTAENRRDISRLPPDSAKPFAFVLDLFVGMPVMVIWNVAQMLGVANGSVGQVAGFRFASDTGFDIVTVNEGEGYKIRDAHDLPECVYVRIENAEFDRIDGLPEIFSDDVFPISARDFRSTRVRLPGRTETAKLRLKQLPIVPAFACTIYKVQGLTIAAIVIAALGMRLLEIYVMFSRVRELTDVILLERFNGDKYKNKKLSQDLLDECDRLSQLGRDTLRKIGFKLADSELVPSAVDGSSGVRKSPVKPTGDDERVILDQAGGQSGDRADGSMERVVDVIDDVEAPADGGARPVHVALLRRCDSATWHAADLQEKLNCAFGSAQGAVHEVRTATENSIVQLAAQSLRQRDVIDGETSAASSCHARALREFDRRALQEIGHYCMGNVVGDGNCLFRALTLLLFGDENATDADGSPIHLRVRRWIAAFFVAHPIFMGNYLDDDIYEEARIGQMRRGADPDGCRRDASLYFSERIRAPPVYGNDACILAAAIMFNVEIRVISGSSMSPLAAGRYMRWAVGGVSPSAIPNVPATALRIRQAGGRQQAIRLTLACFFPTHFDALLPL